MQNPRTDESKSSFVLVNDDQETAAVLSGNWTGGDAMRTGAKLSRAVAAAKSPRLDLTQVGRMDTAGALSIVRMLGERFNSDSIVARPETLRLLNLVGHASRPAGPDTLRGASPSHLLVSIGRKAAQIGLAFSGVLIFIGHLMFSAARTAAHPGRIRWAAWFSQAQTTGLNAIPIISVTSGFIGVVVGLLGMHMLQRFGARIFAVELTGVAVLREFGVVITAVILAGRSASAFAAELGSMRMRREIDAMRLLAVDPIEALVLPRLAALLITMPFLCFVADLCGLAGGMLATWLAIGLTPAGFLERLKDNVGAVHFWVGMSKTPIMAAVIAGIGCHQGFEVGGDVESLGRRVTAAVVHAVFAIIMIDAAFALAYMELNV